MLPHPVAVAANVDDMTVVQQTVDQGRRHDLVAEHDSPFLEALVGGQHGRRDQLLETAVTKYKLYDPKERKDGVEKLWDAWERLKSLEDSHVDKKKESIRLLLEKAAAADTNYFQRLNTEAQALTKIGNDYQIRHSEKRTQAVDDPYQIDYFFAGSVPLPVEIRMA